MKERPIPFNSEMVKAILEGRKTQTRRPIKPQPVSGIVFKDELVEKCPYGQSGDRLWVRETWYCDHFDVQKGPYLKPANLTDKEIIDEFMYYKATDLAPDGKCYTGFSGETMDCPWRPSIHMPRWASRIILEIVDVKVERLQDIRAWEDVLKEGIQLDWYEHDGNEIELIDEFHKYWDSLYIKKPEYQWQANPWVWCLSFKRI